MKKINKLQIVIGSILGVVLLVALGVGLYLSRQSQETRSDASSSMAELYFADPNAGPQKQTSLVVESGKQYQLQLKVDTGTTRIIGYETYLEYDPNQFSEFTVRANNIPQFSFFGQAFAAGNGRYRLLGARPKGSDLIGIGYNAAVLTFTLKPGFSETSIGLRNAQMPTASGTILSGGSIQLAGIYLKAVAKPTEPVDEVTIPPKPTDVLVTKTPTITLAPTIIVQETPIPIITKTPVTPIPFVSTAPIKLTPGPIDE